MNGYQESDSSVDDEPLKRKGAGVRFADLSDRLAKTFGGFDRTREEMPEWEEAEELDLPGQEPAAWEEEEDVIPDRFPVVRHGYDRTAVDDHVAALEREVAKLRSEAQSDPAMNAAIERLGEQTSAILRVAHEQATEITRRAHAEADRCVSEAAANAVAMTEEANRKLRQLDSETDSVWRERMRLIDDVRSVAGSLLTLAQDADIRFPAEGGKSAASPISASRGGQWAPPAPRPATPGARFPTPGAASTPGATSTPGTASSPATASTPGPASSPATASTPGPATPSAPNDPGAPSTPGAPSAASTPSPRNEAGPETPAPGATAPFDAAAEMTAPFTPPTRERPANGSTPEQPGQQQPYEPERGR